MAFVSALWNGTQHTNAFTRDDAYMAVTWIGYESDTSIVYSLMVEMYPTSNGTEFAFPIIRTDRLTGHSEPLFDSSVTNALIPKSYRHSIRELLFSSAERVVRGCNRSSFFMTTFCDNLPASALEKYDHLCEVFINCGYDVVHTEPTSGSHFWQMTKVGSNAGAEVA